MYVTTVCPPPGPSDKPQPGFADPAVQDILTGLTGLDLQKVFRPIQQELKPPKYKLMTDEQLQQVNKLLHQLIYTCLTLKLSSFCVNPGDRIGQRTGKEVVEDASRFAREEAHR